MKLDRMFRAETRLGAIAELVPVCRCMGDIGTDHAWLPIYLVASGRCMKAVASDVKKGPLQAALKNIAAYGLTEAIEIRLGSGLQTLSEGECETIVLAGMGGLLICDLLKRSMDLAKTIPAIVLQPNRDEYEVRRFLSENGFSVTEERAVQEGRHCYWMLVCHFTGEYEKETNILRWHVGDIMWRRKNEQDILYYKKLREKAECMLEGISHSEELNDKVGIKRKEQEALLKRLNEILWEDGYDRTGNHC